MLDQLLHAHPDEPDDLAAEHRDDDARRLFGEVGEPRSYLPLVGRIAELAEQLRDARRVLGARLANDHGATAHA